MSIAVFAGTFDPFTVGHLDIVKRVAPHVEKLYVAVSPNPGKSDAMFSWDERIELIKSAVSGIPSVEVCGAEGLLVDFCHSVNADLLVRSIRSAQDVDYERQLETVNKQLDASIETVYVLSKAETAYISSTLVRQLIALGISIENLVPDVSHPIIQRKLSALKPNSN